jgi:ribonuclease R
MLVEDFMLLANKSVAKFIAQKSKNEIPFIYRVHDLPNPDRLADFATFAKELGFNMKLNTPNQISKSFNQLYKASASNEQLKLLEPLAIRTMAKAEYTTENIGHYGLAFDFYTHFTSPIRRYSDVLVHRILDKNLHGEHRVDKEDLEQKAKHISLQERKATDAERESVKYKQVEYIEDHVGDVFEGVINGMIDRGIFVELIDSKAEGMVSFDRMDEPFEMQENRLKAVGKKTGKTLHFGQQVSVQILSADLDRRQIEMKLVESN